MWYFLGVEETAWKLFNSFAPWFAALGTLAVAAISVYIAVWQIRKQYENTERLQREHKKDELKLQLYKEIGDLIDGAILELIKIKTTISYSIPSALSEYRITSKKPTLNNYEFTHGFHKGTTEVIRVISMMAKYEIVFMELNEERKKAISTHLEELYKAFIQYSTIVEPYLQLTKEEDRQKGITDLSLSQRPPDDKQYEEIKAIGMQCIDILIYIMGSLYDLRVDAQNILLSHLFDNRKVKYIKKKDGRPIEL